MFSQVLTTLHASQGALCHKVLNSISSRPGHKLSTWLPLKRKFIYNIGPTPRTIANRFKNSNIPTRSTPFPKVIVLFIITIIVIQVIIFIIINITIIIIIINVNVIVNAIIIVVILIFVVLLVLTEEIKTSC